MMVLQPNMTLRRTIAVWERAHQFTVQSDRNLVADRLYLVRVPLTGRFGRHFGRRGQRVDRAGHVQWIAKRDWVRIRILARVVNLNFIALIDGRLPVVSRITTTERGKANEDARVIVGIRGPPIDSEDKVRELLRCIPEQPDAIH